MIPEQHLNIEKKKTLIKNYKEYPELKEIDKERKEKKMKTKME